MIELAIAMPDSQVEQLETAKRGERKILLSPSTAHGVGYILDQMLGERIREAGVILEVEAFQFEGNPYLRDAIDNCQLAQKSIKETIYKLLLAKRAWLVISESGKISCQFSKKIIERKPQEGTVIIEGEELKQILGAFEDGIWQNLTVLAGNTETLEQTSRIKGIRKDSRVVHKLVSPLLKVPDQFWNLSQIIITIDSTDKKTWKLIPDRNRVVVG